MKECYGTICTKKLMKGDCNECSDQERENCFKERYEKVNRDLLPSTVQNDLEKIGNLE